MINLCRRLRAIVLAVAACLSSVATQAAMIVLHDVPGYELSAAQRVAMNRAANFWASRITNDVQINLEVGFANLGSNVGAVSYNSPGSVFSVQEIYSRLAGNAASSVDAIAVANLSPLVPGQYSAIGIDSIAMVTPGYTGFNAAGVGYGIDNTTVVFDRDGSYNNTFIFVLPANQKALGLISDRSSIDGRIVFNTLNLYDLNPADGISPDASDFTGVAIHEIAHLLGFSSGVNDYDYFGGPRGGGADLLCLGGAILCRNYPVNDDYWGYALDLFRYSDYFPAALEALVWMPGAPSYFSIDGGVTNLGDLSTGVYHGDGWNASHWRIGASADDVLGIMDPISPAGEMGRISGRDFAALDAIGYNFNFAYNPAARVLFTTANLVPEPESWALLIVGFTGMWLRRRRQCGG